jgi:hypothetical protein
MITKFKDLKVGDIFVEKWEGCVYMKIRNAYVDIEKSERFPDGVFVINAICIKVLDETNKDMSSPGAWAAYNEEAEIDKIDILQLKEE